MAIEMVPYELVIASDGSVMLPLALLAQAGMDAGVAVLALSPSDGRIVLRRLSDAADDLVAGLPPV